MTFVEEICQISKALGLHFEEVIFKDHCGLLALSQPLFIPKTVQVNLTWPYFLKRNCKNEPPKEKMHDTRMYTFP